MERLSRNGSQSRACAAGGRVNVMRLVMAVALLFSLIAPVMGAPDRPGCFIRINRVGQIMHLSAFIETPHPLMGSYQLSVAKEGASGLSRNTQGGGFHAPDPGGAAIMLGTVALRLGPDERLRADLAVFVDGAVICRAVL